jgi:hypothetical protein
MGFSFRATGCVTRAKESWNESHTINGAAPTAKTKETGGLGIDAVVQAANWSRSCSIASPPTNSIKRSRAGDVVRLDSRRWNNAIHQYQTKHHAEAAR